MSQGSSEAKADIRARHRARRAAADPRQRDAAGAALAVYGVAWAEQLTGGTPSTFCAYLGVVPEPPTLPLISELHMRGHTVLLPVCEPGRRLSWTYWTPGVEFVRSRYAPVLEPAGPRLDLGIMASVTALFIPATAVDRDGNRIGQGGGYYDVLLGSLAGDGLEIPFAAVVFDSELLPAGSIPTEGFDRRVPAALTPSGLIRLPDPA
ncbi:5-formyltetrahydrofolate cyclo-ligase [Pseudarthrobacter cellobiosi]|uniref:5-formyltetrahydrofolate cyclo-ligase n=1 Tax=Pseudarthrobacter cellobiosi TaxID=2953654 RepID=UPI00208F65BF|nr:MULTISPECIES: 5-formyltetrahydrofolate cyclo-ligase [unclassified Pseudarthrobacter]MCO4256699.1 5-formyltetrahydrofolate cyclo-ligase [Pseudarthrobacter sp. HLT1-5]MCO4275037.1 5-formyltetrahydrofolate cyclo-ligase [Pseudarthrobacter sp. HLT3-5]